MSCTRASTLLTLFLTTTIACGNNGDQREEEVVKLDFDMGNQGAQDMGPLKKRTPLCEENQRVEDHQCIPCEPGRERPAGDDPDGINTWCESSLCGVNERVQDYQCVPCSIEEYNDQAHHAAHGDSSCLRDRCSETIGAACKRFYEAYIKTESPDSHDSFGKQVLIHDNLLLVGQVGEFRPDCRLCGAVMIYERVRSDRWEYRARLTSSLPNFEAFFGASIALHDDMIIVGAPGEDGDGMDDVGGVHIFMRGDEDPWTWTETQSIQAFNAGAYDNFGSSLAISADGQRLAVGAPREDGLADDLEDSGAAYLYERVGDTWKAAGYIRPSDLNANARFGTSLAIDQGELAVGAPNKNRAPSDEAEEELAEAGAVYLYTLANAKWELLSTLSPEVQDARDHFGAALAMLDGKLLVGAPGEDSADTGFYADPLDQGSRDSGAAYLFKRLPNEQFDAPILFKPTYTMPGMAFGASLSMTPDMLVVGAPKEGSGADSLNGDPTTSTRQTESGAVFVFRPYSASLAKWEQIAAIKARDKGSRDHFGAALSASGYSVAIGAPFEDSGEGGTEAREGGSGTQDAGAVYIRNVGHFKYR